MVETSSSVHPQLCTVTERKLWVRCLSCLACVYDLVLFLSSSSSTYKDPLFAVAAFKVIVHVLQFDKDVHADSQRTFSYCVSKWLAGFLILNGLNGLVTQNILKYTWAQGQQVK